METIKRKRMTKQRSVIYKALCSTDCHPNAEWIYNKVRQEIPEISLGTVYRNLQVLRDDGKINGFSFGQGQCRFDANTEPHGHFVCRSCGRILDFPAEGLLNKEALAKVPGKVNSLQIECYGVCKDCLER